MLGKSPYPLLLAAALIWGGNFVAGKALVAHIPPITLAALRWSLAFALLAPFYGKAAWRLRAEFLRDWRTVVFVSLTGVAGFNTLTYIAVQYTGSINASLMNAATPIFVVLLSRMMMRETIAWAALPGILLSIAGVAWIIGRGRIAALAGLSFNRGDLWMLAAILCWSLYSVGMKKASGRHPGGAFLLAQVVVALIVLLPLSAAEWISGGSGIAWNGALVAGVGYIGIFASIVAFLCWNRAIDLAGPQRCAGFLNLIPLFSAVFATLFTGEWIRLYHVAGAALIISGVYFTNRTLRAGRARPLREE